MTFTKTGSILAASLAFIGLSGCATISAEQCLAGNWEERGYNDGANGVGRERLLDYADTCAEHGAIVNREAYLQTYAQGLETYCTQDNGYKLGESGAMLTNVCTGDAGELFKAAYYDGRVVYDLRVTRSNLVAQIEDIEGDIENVRSRLQNLELDDAEYKRLRAKRDRLEDERTDLRQELRSFDYQYGF